MPSLTRKTVERASRLVTGKTQDKACEDNKSHLVIVARRRWAMRENHLATGEVNRANCKTEVRSASYTTLFYPPTKNFAASKSALRVLCRLRRPSQYLPKSAARDIHAKSQPTWPM